MLLAAALCLGLPGLAGPAAAQGLDLAGPYLAAQRAAEDGDYRRAANYYSQALLADPANPALAEATILSYLGIGDIDRALVVARNAATRLTESQVAQLLTLAAAAKGEDYARLSQLLDEGVDIGSLVSGLLGAWTHLGRGNMTDATAAFDRVAAEPGLEAFGLYHKALALASVGDFEGAEAIFASPAGAPLTSTRRGAQAQIQILSQLERNADATLALDTAFGPDLDPAMEEARAQLEAGEALPFTVVGSRRDGIAEVFYTLAGALSGEAPDVFTLVHARLAEYLRPGHVDAILMTAALLELQGQYDLAAEAYARVPRDDPGFHVAEIGRATAMVRAGRVEAAVEALEQLTRSHGDLPQVWVALGDTLRREERYGEAARAYDRAVALFSEPTEGQWFVYFARAISFERESDWDRAEPDFRRALELSPDQPEVLNYLGYSFLERQENFEEALDMIERAVAARPEDGHILDSLGWGYYRVGRYEEAVVAMEQAIEKMPGDPLVNDHLGDVYWAVGRTREARIQWRRALSLDPETEEEVARIRRKLEVGLDRVLDEEGAEPLRAAQNGE